ncbi:bifunctional 2-polyprenyl-6-hydroxyphenol methylase/3-demethylubiquinol 3-O-methyltransferase UbiG [Motiliproteus sp. MSK22-1]|uniref:class I SAM-dependent methyltransferase n=1 Tax=Motiliproteus sp. MSK22-1 TaxID=1897630 RepID=UPI000977E809|nr:methyltransferase domain-containing protein [Motiliproteus sp. MSK22-1]OMH39458.1 hypothetical protein BGP75_02360 [Motiliproteus sp. MSK22-1]
MISSPVDKWNQRYLKSSTPNSPAQVLTENLHLLPAQGRALELACGLGGNALLLAKQGLTTEAWDLSEVAINKLQQLSLENNLSINARVVDLNQEPPVAESYDVICVSAYLERTLCSAISNALKPGGLIFYQTFTQQKTDNTGPSNPDFLLESGELFALFADLIPVAYRQESDCGDLSRGLRNQAYLIARKPV